MIGVTIGLEHGLDRDSKYRSNSECKGEGRLVFLGFDRIDCLARDGGLLGEIALGPAFLGAEYLEPALHLYFLMASAHPPK